MKTMDRIFDRCDIDYKHTNKRSFQYDTFAYILGRKCSETVNSSMDGLILLTFEEIETLINSFPDTRVVLVETDDGWDEVRDENAVLTEDEIWYQDNAEKLDNCLNEALNHKIGCLKLNEGDVLRIISRLDRIASEPEHIKLMNNIIGWYGVKRASVRIEKDYIPQDVGRGIYDDQEYCGTTAKEFISGTPRVEEIASL